MPGHSAGPVGGITVVERSDSTIARLWGEVDESLREQASTALARAVDRELPVVIEAGDVEFVDSTGIAFLIQFCRIAREEGLPVTLVHAPPVVTTVLTMLGLDQMFDSGPEQQPAQPPDASAGTGDALLHGQGSSSVGV